MKRLMYKFRRHRNVIQILGIIMSIIGLIIMLKIIPIHFYLFALSVLFMVLGWFLFKLH